MPNIRTTRAHRLINETSPYLLQHAYNPVEWFPWGDEAFERAGGEDKPIFLSIGYSTCHWCHVMAKECFEDEQVAELLNRYYVSIKVDREERPDIDQVYMAACQAMTGSGGWPLTVIMTPAGKPFFAGTYFSKEEKWGRPGLMGILKQIARAWENERENINNIGSSVVYRLQNSGQSREGKFSENILKETYNGLENSFDKEYGGFGNSTKFPMPHNLLFLLRYWKETGEKRAIEIVHKTLYAMAHSALYDQLGFGFHRYATDRRWSIPHFEKTLYDNALLAFLYTEAYQATKEEYYGRIAREIFTYIRREMTSPEKGFYTAEDADSEGREGKFYLWTPEEVKEILGPGEGENFCRAYGITSGGSVEGGSIPNPNFGREEIGDVPRQPEGSLKDCREKLFIERNKRVHPSKDDKILTSWNGLMIAALAKGGRVLADRQLVGEAAGAARFILTKLRTPRGRLVASYREGVTGSPGFVDDYAFMGWGLLELYEATFEPWYLARAVEISREILSLFWDSLSGGLFFSGSDSEELVIRNKEIHDGAIPSGNSVASYNFLRLARLTGDRQWEERGRQIFSTFSEEANQTPSAHTFLMMSYLFATTPPLEIIISGTPGAEDTEAMIDRVNKVYLPHKTMLLQPGGNLGKELGQWAPHINDLPTAGNGRATAYICRNFACRAPLTDLEFLAAELESDL